jgi:hypothetical protein
LRSANRSETEASRSSPSAQTNFLASIAVHQLHRLEQVAGDERVVLLGHLRGDFLAGDAKGHRSLEEEDEVVIALKTSGAVFGMYSLGIGMRSSFEGGSPLTGMRHVPWMLSLEFIGSVTSIVR